MDGMFVEVLQQERLTRRVKPRVNVAATAVVNVYE